MGRLLVFLMLSLSMGKAFALTNSQPAIGDFSTFNVWLKIDGSYENEDYLGYCNGSLIADDLVITAAHCLAGSVKKQNEIQVMAGNYKITSGKRRLALYHSAIDTIKSKRIFFPKSLDKKIKKGKILRPGSISAYEDMALVELERPVDRSKVNVQLVELVTPQEHAMVTSQPDRYTFIALSTNLIAAVGDLQTKRYVSMQGMSFHSLINRAYHLPMTNSVSLSSTEEGDSGAPVLVNVSGKWKLFALVKGTKRDFLSVKLNEWTNKDISITPILNMYTPISDGMSDLLEQVHRPSFTK